MVRVYDLGFTECLRLVVFHGEREISSEQTKQLYSSREKQQLGRTLSVHKQGFLLPLSDCEFSATNVIEDLHSSPQAVTGHRPLRSTGVAISVAVGLLERCLITTGSRVLVFTSSPATIGPGLIVDSDFSHVIRTH